MFFSPAPQPRHREHAVRLSKVELQGPVPLQRAPSLRPKLERSEAKDFDGFDVRRSRRPRFALELNFVAWSSTVSRSTTLWRIQTNISEDRRWTCHLFTTRYFCRETRQRHQVRSSRLSKSYLMKLELTILVHPPAPPPPKKIAQ